MSSSHSVCRSVLSADSDEHLHCRCCCYATRATSTGANPNNRPATNRVLILTCTDMRTLHPSDRTDDSGLCLIVRPHERRSASPRARPQTATIARPRPETHSAVSGARRARVEEATVGE